MMKYLHSILSVLVISLFMVSCERDVDIDFPDVESQVVVDGAIFLGEPPLLFLTRTQSFNAPLDPSSLSGLFVNDATVTISNGTDTVPLTEICAEDLSPDELEIAAELLGIAPEDLAQISYCIYTDLSGEMLGELETDYLLEIETIDGQQLDAQTRIGTPIPLDSLWFQFWADSDSLGFIHGWLNDPPGERNAYRWRAQRINSYPNGEQKDFGMIAPLGSTFEDRFFDGLSFEIFYNRGNVPNSAAEDDNNEEDGFFKLNDTVVVEFSSVPLEVYDYYTISDDQLVNNGSPFAVPTNLPSNVNGGLGLWAGYAPVYDTVICVP
ncbi:MAG: DUF4249 domain-containing protein [Flavobacteriales bacterium]|nr:DUF4249 domain-containing protein [Flavobacteriales bacterium]